MLEQRTATVLALVEDLMLASKIREAASRAGQRLSFVRTAAEAIQRIRSERPVLIIVDLDSASLHPVDTIREMRGDPTLSPIPTLAFVSHVHADLAAAARTAGAGRVLARSAFFEKLPEILREAASTPESTREAARQAAGAQAPFVRPSLADMFRARARIAGHVRRTPLVQSAWLSSACGGDVRLKLESLQVTNAFKARGAVNALVALVEKLHAGETAPQLVTASAGNHGRALAYAAERLGLHAVVFTPRDAPRTKLDAIRRHGAELRPDADTYDQAERMAKDFARREGLFFLSPYSDVDVIAGAGTIALEVFEDFPEVDTFIVPVGGGGLASAIGLAARAASSGIRVIGVETEASHAFADSIRAGRITEIEVGQTIADGLAGNMDPETITFDLVRDYVDELCQVSEENLADGIRGLVAHEHLIAEGAGIACVAAALSGRLDLHGRRVAIIVSGSNIDAERLVGILRGGP